MDKNIVKTSGTLLLVLLVTPLHSCGGGFTKFINRDFKEDQITNIDLKNYSKDTKQYDSINTNKEYEIYSIYSYFSTEYVNEMPISSYETSIEKCIETYEIKFTLKDLTSTIIKYYVYDNTKGTVVYGNGSAYTFYGNAKCGIFKSLKKHFSGEDDGYKIYIHGDSKDLVNNKFINNIYSINDEVTFQTKAVLDVGTYIYIDNILLTGTPVSNSNNTQYTFTMPNHDVVIHLTHNKFYIDREYKFKEIFSNFTDEYMASISEIRTTLGFNGTLQLNNDCVKCTKSLTDISNISTLFTQSFVKVDNNEIDGGTSLNYLFLNADNNSINVNFNNDLLVYTDFSSYQYFRPVNNLDNLVINEPYIILSKFSSSLSSTYNVKTNDDKKTQYGSYSYLQEIEFKQSETNTTIDECNYYCESPIGNIYIYNDKTFVFNDTTYLIINGCDFSYITH